MEGTKKLLAKEKMDNLFDRLKMLLAALQDQYGFDQPLDHTKVIDQFNGPDYLKLEELWDDLGSVTSYPPFRILTRLMWKLRVVSKNNVVASRDLEGTSYDQVLFLITEIYNLIKNSGLPLRG